MARTGIGGALPHACPPTGRGVGNTSAPCGGKTGGADAPPRSGETSNHRRSDARGGDDPRAHRAPGRRVAQRDLGKAGRAENPIRGPGRGSVSREKRVMQKTRYHITHIARREDKIAALSQRLGWKAFVTNAGHKRLPLQDAVLCYRNEYRVERIFNRLKSRVHIAPLFVKLNDQIEGLTYLLTLGVRVLTVMEFVLRRSLQTDQTTLPGLHPENKTRLTDKPTAERILTAFADVSLTIIKNAAGEEILRRLTSLSGLQEDILQRLGLGASLYGQLEIQEMGN